MTGTTSLARAMRAAARAAQAQAQATGSPPAAQATGSPPAAQASSTSGSAPHHIPTSGQGEQGPALNVMWDIQEHRYPNIGQALDTLLVQATDPSGFWPNGWPDELSSAAH